jgi:DNA-binding NarL/FixJ family response regulator
MNNTPQNPIRVLLIENQTLTRIGIKTILEAQNDFEIVGETDSGAKGFTLFLTLKPDVIILGLRLPDSCAIDTLGDYFAKNNRVKILVLADTAGDAEISKALKKGALGYICKDISPDELVKSIRTVATGKKYIPSDIAEILSENIGREELTPTETRILNAVVAGKSNKEIAYDLNISENTVKTHVKNVFDKLGVSDRTSAATLAIKRGLVRIHL